MENIYVQFFYQFFTFFYSYPVQNNSKKIETE